MGPGNKENGFEILKIPLEMPDLALQRWHGQETRFWKDLKFPWPRLPWKFPRPRWSWKVILLRLPWRFPLLGLP